MRRISRGLWKNRETGDGSVRSVFRKLFNYETVSYIIVGLLTTAVDYIVFAVVNELMKSAGAAPADTVLPATVLSWLAAVAFAYIANKLAVFRNFNFSVKYLIKEAGSFFAARILSGVIVFVFMWAAVSVMGWNEYISKLFATVFNLVFNYAASKFFIFKK